MKRHLVAICIVASLVVSGGNAWGETLQRSLTDRVVVNPDGTAVITHKEMVPETSLKKIYLEHANQASENKEVADNYLGELSKTYYLLFGSKPDLEIAGQDTSSREFSRGVVGKIQGLVQQNAKDKTIREISLKRYDNEKKEKDCLQYFESILDGRSFETMYLASLPKDQSLYSENSFSIELPKGSTIVNTKELMGKTWKVDFGGGNTMDAVVDVNEKDAIVTIREKVMVTESKPSNLLSEKNEPLFTSLRDYEGLTIQYKEQDGSQAALTRPREMETGLDYSNSWSFNVSHNFSYPFSYSTLTVTPSANLGFNFGASVYWEHYWKKTGWFTWRWTLKKFETTVSVNPSLGLNVQVQSGGTIQKDWDTNIITKQTTLTFWVVCVPVVIVLEAKLDLGATANITGTIGFNTGVSLNVNTSLTTKYENGWSVSTSKSITPTFNGFTASAQVSAMARGEAPFTLSAYIYYIAGPFAQLVPYLQGNASAQAGTTTGVAYSIVGGLDVNGGVHMAGWLKDIVGDVGNYSTTFYNWQYTIASGSYTIPPPPQ